MRKSRPAKAVKITTAVLKSLALPEPDESGDKESRGSVFALAGSRGLAGGAILAATAALHAGAGKIQIAVPESIASLVEAKCLEALVVSIPDAASGKLATKGSRAVRDYSRSANAVLLGPGMSKTQSIANFVKAFDSDFSESIVVLDAEALISLKSDLKRLVKHSKGVIITPHAGEMATLTGIDKELILEDQQRFAEEFATEYGVTVVLKGPTTFITSPNGVSHSNEDGGCGLATAGSGDVLAGIIAGLAARGAIAHQAAVWGVSLHARAGAALAKRIGEIGFLARDLSAEVPGLLERLK